MAGITAPNRLGHDDATAQEPQAHRCKHHPRAAAVAQGLPGVGTAEQGKEGGFTQGVEQRVYRRHQHHGYKKEAKGFNAARPAQHGVVRPSAQKGDQQIRRVKQHHRQHDGRRKEQEIHRRVAAGKHIIVLHGHSLLFMCAV